MSFPNRQTRLETLLAARPTCCKPDALGIDDFWARFVSDPKDESIACALHGSLIAAQECAANDAEQGYCNEELIDLETGDVYTAEIQVTWRMGRAP